jgi:Sulfotransferase family
MQGETIAAESPPGASTATEPIFLLSLPRAGSTLLQRMLAAHSQIASAAETWLLLPFLYTLRRDGAKSEYGHSTAVRAIEEFYSHHLDGGRRGYLDEGRRFFLRLYADAADGLPYFLDKTPRYHLAVAELLELFPAARVVFLWRNPLAVAASIIDSWNAGNWNLDTHRIDLQRGLAGLVSAYENAGPRAVSVRYEDLIDRPAQEIARVVRELGLPHEAGLGEAFGSVELPGSMGDYHGRRRYTEVSREPLEKWQATLANPFRRAWAKRYLGWVGRERLALQGYDYDDLQAQLDALPLRLNHTGGDVARVVYRGARRQLARIGAA